MPDSRCAAAGPRWWSPAHGKVYPDSVQAIHGILAYTKRVSMSQSAQLPLRHRYFRSAHGTRVIAPFMPRKVFLLVRQNVASVFS